MGNQLQHLGEFQELLADYHIDDTNPALKDVQLVLMIGATASGRDSIIHELVDGGHYTHLVSSTTREPRTNNGVMEQNGVEYWFKTEDEMLRDLRDGQMLEAEVIHGQQVSGISIAELERAVSEDKIGITNVDLNIDKILIAKPDAFAVMILPPSFEEGLRRLNGRGQLTDDEVTRRLKTARQIYEAGLSWGIFKFVVNDSLRHAAKQVDAIVQGDSGRSEQDNNQELVAELLAGVENWLETHVELAS